MTDQPITPTNTSEVTAPNPVTPTPAQAEQTQDPAWLPDRLERARKAALNDFAVKAGLKDASELEKALGKVKQIEEAAKTDAEKLVEYTTKATTLEAQVNNYSSFFQELLTEETDSLTKEQKAEVDAILEGITDSVARLRAVRRMKKLIVAPSQPKAPNIDAAAGISKGKGQADLTPEQKRTIASKFGLG